MSQRLKKILIILVILVICIGFGLWWWLQHRPLAEQPAPVLPATTASINQLPVGPGAPTITPAVTAVAPKLEATLKAVAMSFSERWGSYSTENDFRNVDDVMPLMTPTMQASAQQTVANQKTAWQKQSGYYSITTRAISATIAKLDEVLGRAEITVITQRQESTGVTKTSARYQPISLRFVKTDSGWLVDGATWQ